MPVFVTKIIAFLAAAVVQAIPLIYGSTGEIITEKSGHLNLGIPGIMYMGGISGIIGGYLYEHYAAKPVGIVAVLISLAASLVGSALMALIYSFLTVTLRANQNVTGLSLTIFGVGVGNFFGGSLLKFFGQTGSIYLAATSTAYRTTIPFLSKIPVVGTLFFSYGFLAYLAVIIALLSSRVLNKTRVGLSLRAVGESPATADAAGVNVTAYKYLATLIGGMIAGLGGLYFVMDATGGGWTNGGFGDKGWLAIAIVIFALWKPKNTLLCSFIFGALYILCVYIPGLSAPMKEIIKMMPYVVTVAVLIFISIRNKRENMPPASLGTSYFREER
ncbi:MAG: ABC transporter permease [Clostridia bacterium]|nr:ABC transporter permease [Clostridia bacterium]MBR5423494.1 ABC transporter permease [Clostridia bacterium]